MNKSTKAYLALLFICIVWGTTYLVIRIAVLHCPSFLFAGLRQVISGIIILIAGFMMSKRIDLSKSNIAHQALVGFLLITVGNGLVSWGEMHIPSGVAALICSLMPIVTVIINLAISKKEKINLQIFIGMALGFSGVALIFRNDISNISNKAYLLGAFATLIATSSWSLGSVINKKKTAHINPLFNSGLQLFFGGILLFVCSPFIDDYSHLHFFQKEVIGSLAYLIIFGSVLAYSAYMYALKELPVGVVALYAYINPLVAVVLGYFILNEPLTWFTVIAFITIVTGVYIVKYGYKLQHQNIISTSSQPKK